MAGNSFGELFRVTTFGESHGAAIGAIVDGCPPGLELSVEEIQRQLDRRKPGQSRFTTARREADSVQVLSGVFEGKTTGAPIGLLIHNSDQRSQDYGAIKDLFVPVMQTTPMPTSMVIEIIGVAVAHLLVKRRCELLPALLPCNGSPSKV